MSWKAALSRTRGRRSLSIVVLLCSGVLAGCGSGDPFDYVKVSGKVTYEDESLIPADRVTGTSGPPADPADERTHPRPGVAEVSGADGTFDVVSSHRYGDGVVRGKHKVLIISLDKQEVPTDAIPPEYADRNQTPLQVDTADSPYHFKLKKPQ